MKEAQRTLRLAELAEEAQRAERRAEGWVAGDLWRRYELVRDGGRDPDELLAEGVELSRVALDLAAQDAQNAP